jgi:hypothetical protein
MPARLIWSRWHPTPNIRAAEMARHRCSYSFGRVRVAQRVLVVAACHGEQAVSSLRPLITISILGIICLVLYMKINETEPVVPADVAEWDISGDLDIGEVAIGDTPSGGASLGEVSIGDSGGVDLENIDIGGATTAAPPAQTTTTTPAYQATTTAPAFGSAPSFGSTPAYGVGADTTIPPAVTETTAPAMVAPAQPTAQPSTTPVAEKKPAETRRPKQNQKSPALPTACEIQ